MIMIIQGYVILMKNSFCGVTILCRTTATMSHKMVYLCQRYTKINEELH